jgi:hypothetical protein
VSAPSDIAILVCPKPTCATRNRVQRGREVQAICGRCHTPLFPTPKTEGPYRGSTCVAGPGGHWGRATIRRVNEDGTFTIAPEEKPSLLVPYYYGVTSAEVSFDDAARWTTVLSRLTGGSGQLDAAGFAAALSLFGFSGGYDEVVQFWVDTCEEQFGFARAEAGDARLDPPQAYVLCLAAGISAKSLNGALAAGGEPQSYYKLYWNLTRMGGREPDEILRPITLDDALVAVGAAESGADEQVAAQLQAFEKAHDVAVPNALKTLFTRQGIAAAVHSTHPNNPQLETAHSWELRRDLRRQGLEGDFAITIMLPHQGDHEWAAVFDDSEPDARVYLWWEDENAWELTAPTIGMFFWDLAQTGLAWYRETGFEGGPPTVETDIGLAVRR